MRCPFPSLRLTKCALSRARGHSMSALTALAVGLVFFLPSCGIYSFSGSSIPSHIKTVSIPLFEDRTTQPGLAEELTRSVRQAYIENNSLKVTEQAANSLLRVALTGYRHEPSSYDEQGTVREYRVVITATAVFRDEQKGLALWKDNNIPARGLYTAESPAETETDGRRRALKDLSDYLIENTISGW